ncbi:MAG TPA: hypothetical protein VMV86_01395 [Methanosarcinales archaeon]|nr:hypothetical protein [Methanosarcinales archaeon]
MKVHQNIVIDGVDYGDRKSRKNSKFCNEGKWYNFVAPLLPDDCSEMTFMEMGANAGMYLKLAQDKGFKQVIGMEADKEAYHMALNYVDCEMWNTKLDEHFDYDTIPATDVTLLANFHYHIFMPVFLHYLNILRRKTKYVIVVTAGVKTSRHFPNTDLNSIREYFKLWEEVAAIDDVSKEGDPHPRDMQSILFKSELQRVSIPDITSALGRNGGRHYRVAKQIVEKKEFPFTNPLLLLKNGRIIDGSHRLATLEKNGHVSALVEYV